MIAEHAAIRRSVVVDSQLAILRDLGFPVTEASRILDFGCGEGHTVEGYRALGYNAFGCDVIPVRGEYLRTMLEGRIPFPDSMFDVVVSEQVFEHVMDYDRAVSEICRVLKPGGVAIHDFPSRWRPIEPHVWVPLGCFIRSRPWLAFWAICGISNSYQGGSSWGDVARRNRDWLLQHTNYLAKPSLRRIFNRYFSRVQFREDLLLKHAFGRAHILKPFRRVAGPLYGAFHERFVVCWKPSAFPESGHTTHLSHLC